MLNTSMLVKSTLRKLMARENLRRADTGQPQLTQAQIARESGVPQSVISTLVNGKSQRIDFKTIARLCLLFGVQPGDLFECVSDDVQRVA